MNALSATAPQARRVLQVEGLSKRFRERTVLHELDLTIDTGQIVVLMGPSGAGKSTLLRCVNFLEQPDAGAVWVAGERMGFHQKGTRWVHDTKHELRRKRARIGMVFQRFNLFANLTALDNVAIGPRKVLGLVPDEARRRASALLAQVHLSGHEQKYPRQLSGGEQQRVAIARALAMEPVLLLLDEPTSALDPELVGEVLGVITQIARTGMTMLIATHEMSFAREVADSVVFMERGRFVEENTAERMFTQPREERTRQFLARVLREEMADATR